MGRDTLLPYIRCFRVAGDTFMSISCTSCRQPCDNPSRHRIYHVTSIRARSNRRTSGGGGTAWLAAPASRTFPTGGPRSGRHPAGTTGCGSPWARSASGPRLMLVVVVLAMAVLSPVFLTHPQPRQRARARPPSSRCSRWPSCWSSSPGASTCRSARRSRSRPWSARWSSRRCRRRPLVVVAMLGTGTVVGAVNGIVLRLGPAAPPVHRHPRHAERRPGPGPVALGRPAAPRHARRHPDARRRLDRLAAVLDPARRRPGAARDVLLTTRLVWGRWIYAVGGNPEAARRAAIPVNGVLISVYVLSGLAAGIAALHHRRAGSTPARPPSASWPSWTPSPPSSSAAPASSAAAATSATPSSAR